jgi:hypothetical protein
VPHIHWEPQSCLNLKKDSKHKHEKNPGALYIFFRLSLKKKIRKFNKFNYFSTIFR